MKMRGCHVSKRRAVIGRIQIDSLRTRMCASFSAQNAGLLLSVFHLFTTKKKTDKSLSEMQ